ncbi:hypothetical protein JTE90_015437 [Oedothorax gibbosus]|uniref:Uncharacterized protein n=1 Tax=Oedothorax gibbosus TaxID=931172 RepID=A0AAV6TNZ1_9ARAC|nr:hypothetical protein JTE90_015437 [Oedothorax gibbosus]
MPPSVPLIHYLVFRKPNKIETQVLFSLISLHHVQGHACFEHSNLFKEKLPVKPRATGEGSSKGKPGWLVQKNGQLPPLGGQPDRN